MRELMLNLLGISVSVGAVGVALSLLRRRIRVSAGWLCVCWAILALRLLIPFNLPISVLSLQPQTALCAVQKVDASGGTGTPAAEGTDISAPQQGSVSGSEAVGNSFRTAAVLIWAAGTAAFALWQSLLYFFERRRLLRWSRAADEETVRAAQIIAADMRIRQSFRILVSDKAASPLLMGVLRPVIVIPTGSDRQKRELVLRHELAHLKRGDILLKLLLTAANAAHWFDPLVWLLTAQAEKDIEAACDESALACADSTLRRAYCEAILDMIANRRVPFSTAFAIRKEDIMNRFERIFDTAPVRGGASVAAAVLCCSLLLSGLIGCTAPADVPDTEPTAIIDTQPAPQEEYIVRLNEAEDAQSFVVSIDRADNGTGCPGTAAAAEAINRYRAEKGLSALRIASPADGTGLYEAAMLRLEEIMASFSHTRPNGEDFSAAYAGSVSGGSDFVELLGAGQPTAEMLINGFIAANKEDRLLGDHTDMCVVAGKSSDGQIYWVFAACRL